MHCNKCAEELHSQYTQSRYNMHKERKKKKHSLANKHSSLEKNFLYRLVKLKVMVT